MNIWQFIKLIAIKVLNCRRATFFSIRLFTKVRLVSSQCFSIVNRRLLSVQIRERKKAFKIKVTSNNISLEYNMIYCGRVLRIY